MKKIIMLIVCLLFMMSSLPGKTFAQNEIKVFVNTQPISFSVKPVNEGGSILVQFRPIFESLGYNVTYSTSGSRLYINGEKNGRIVTFIIGEKIAFAEGKSYTLSTAPKRINGNSMVPLRFIAEASGYEVVWKPSLNRVDITYTSGDYIVQTTDSANVSNPNTTANDGIEESLFEYKNIFRWGVSVNDVKAELKVNPVLERTNDDGNKEIVYLSSFGGSNGRVGYTFDNTGLIEIMYLSESSSDFRNSLATYAGCYMDLSYLYNNGEGPSDKRWNASNITIQAYKEVYGNDNQGMTEMAMRSNELTLLANYQSLDSDIYLVMQNTGVFLKPDYLVGLKYAKK